VALCESIRFVLTFFGSFFVSRQKNERKEPLLLVNLVGVQLKETKFCMFAYTHILFLFFQL
jgi:hypothetical protein